MKCEKVFLPMEMISWAESGILEQINFVCSWICRFPLQINKQQKNWLTFDLWAIAKGHFLCPPAAPCLVQKVCKWKQNKGKQREERWFVITDTNTTIGDGPDICQVLSKCVYNHLKMHTLLSLVLLSWLSMFLWHGGFLKSAVYECFW